MAEEIADSAAQQNRGLEAADFRAFVSTYSADDND
jgi:hypothetical protein